MTDLEKTDLLYKHGCLFGLKNKDFKDKTIYEGNKKYNLIRSETVLVRSKEIGNFLESIDLNRVLFINKRDLIKDVVITFCNLIGIRYFNNKFIPGTFTNPISLNYKEAEYIFITHDRQEKKCFKEALENNIKIIGINNLVKNSKKFHKVIYCNNFSRDSVITILWLILNNFEKTKEITLDDFYSKIKQITL